MSINKIRESTASTIKPETSAPINSQRSQQASEVVNTQTTKPLPEAGAQQNGDAPRISDEELQQAIDKIQHFTENVEKNLEISIDKDTDITVVKVIDTQTKEIIRQFPTEETVSIARTLDKVQGLLFSDKA